MKKLASWDMANAVSPRTITDSTSWAILRKNRNRGWGTKWGASGDPIVKLWRERLVVG